MKGFLVQAAWKHFCWNPPPPQPPPMDKTSGYLKAINVRLSPNYLSKAIQRNRQPFVIVSKGVVEFKPLQASWKKMIFLEILKIVRNSGMRCNCGLVIYCHPSGGEREYRSVYWVCAQNCTIWKDGFHKFCLSCFLSFSRNETIR